MYDALRATYRFHCATRPHGAPRAVALSAFRSVERLAGAAHPAVYRISFACDCGEDHVGLVRHDELDLSTLAARGEAPTFYNVLTGRSEPLLDELAELVRLELQRGNWPWRLYCSRESRVKAVFPSSMAMVAAAEGERRGLVGVVMRCPTCRELSLNLVSARHLDVPFYHDARIRYVDRPFGDGRDTTVERFHEQLHSARFDVEREGL